MSGSTSKYKFPYPTGSDQLWQGAKKIQELAEKMDRELGSVDRAVQRVESRDRGLPWKVLKKENVISRSRGNILYREQGGFVYVWLKGLTFTTGVSSGTIIATESNNGESFPDSKMIFTVTGTNGKSLEVLGTSEFSVEKTSSNDGLIRFHRQLAPSGTSPDPNIVFETLLQWPHPLTNFS